MKYRGVVYDVGLKFNEQGFSVEPFDPTQVYYDMCIIAKEMQANAVRIEGEEILRLETAARAAHSMGLTVFFNPWKMNEDVNGTRTYLEDAAKTAEKLRNEGVDVIFVAGCEYTIFSKGVFPGETFSGRVKWLGSEWSTGYMTGEIPDVLREKSKELNKILLSFAQVIRAYFGGLLTYSAGT